MKKVEISVIITAYNQEKYIEQAIKSVLAQSFKNYEIIVVDDGSTDGTKKVVEKYKNKVTYYYKKNGGHADARNYGIKKARAEIIAFLDSDDLWTPKKLEICYKELKSENIDFVYTNGHLINAKGTIIEKNIKPKKITRPYPKILLGNFISCQTALIKKKCFNKVKFGAGIDMYEDWDFFNNLTKNYNSKYLNIPLFLYRTTNNSKLTKKQILLRLRRQLIVLSRAFKRDKNLTVFFKLRCISNVYFDMAKACLYRRQFLYTVKFSFLSVLFMPFSLKIFFFILKTFKNKFTLILDCFKK